MVCFGLFRTLLVCSVGQNPGIVTFKLMPVSHMECCGLLSGEGSSNLSLVHQFLATMGTEALASHRHNLTVFNLTAVYTYGFG
jgi:hypothetical protein